ncbi:MAG: ABC transporter transmembrane domain-containing protein [Granulosicoccaceae bacterium]
MVNGLFAYILKYSKRQQIILTLMTILSFPFYYLSLDLPKTIINDAISGTNFPIDASIDIASFSLSIGTLGQIPYLLLLCFAFLLLVLVNSGFKLFINIYRGVLGERMLRRMRLQLIERIMKFPLARFRSTSQGELVSMVNQETEPLGGFIGESISLPLYQGGLLFTILVFMFVQDWKLGLAAIALYPVQAWLIPKLQREVNLLNQQRTIRMRKLAENLGEVVAGINEVHINDNSNFFKDHFSKLLGAIFNIRVQIYKKKFLIKFLNNSFAQLTPFLFFLIGGLLVIRGELTIGALVAAVAAYKDLSPPWKELLGWYQSQADARLKYAILTEQFQIDQSKSQTLESLSPQWLAEQQTLPIVANNLSLKRSDGILEIDNVSLAIDHGDWVSLVGTGNSGKNGLAQIIAGLTNPTNGKVLIAQHDATQIPKITIGRAMSYVGHDSYLFAASIRDNLLLSLKYKPQDDILNNSPDDKAIYFENWLQEAHLSGNSEVNPNANWVDHHSAGAANADQLTERIGSILRTVGAEDDLVRYALARTINPEDYPELTSRIVKARELFKEEVTLQGLGPIVEFLDPNQYNENTSLAENILFGTSNLNDFSADGLTEHATLRPLLQKYELAESLDAIAVSTATTMVELFSDLPPGHEFFERYSFLEADDLIQLKRILGLLQKPIAIDELEPNDKLQIRSIPYRLISGRHRVGTLGDQEKQNVVKLRKSFAQNLDADSRDQIDFFSPDSYNAFMSVGENIIFGRIVYGRLGAEEKVYSVILDVLQRLDLMSPILEIGLSAPAGLAGSLLPVSQQQKLVLARGLIKQPRVLVINEGLSALDGEETENILSNLKREYPQLSLLWVDSQPRISNLFDRFAYLQAGKLSRLEASSSNTVLKTMPDSGSKKSPVRLANSVDDDEKLALLNSIPMFRLLDKPQLILLASNCEAKNVTQGERVFKQGDPGDSLFIIVDGTAGIMISNGVSEQKVRECGANEVIGELALLSDKPRSASVDAITDLAILYLRRDVFIEMLRTDGEIGYQILQVVVNRFVDSNQKLAKLIES